MPNPVLNHEVEWTGHYEQGGSKHDVTFQDIRLGTDGSITGGGKDGVGNFKVTGKLTGSDVHFDKAYQGAHTVKYSGKLESGSIKGGWEVGGAKGGFEIRMKTKQWKGFYTYGGQKHDMLVSLNTFEKKDEDTFLSGLGSDNYGNYSIQGFVPRATGYHVVAFNKVYFGQSNSPVHYSGILSNQAGVPTIKGHWYLPASNEVGDFELVKQP